MSFGGGDQRYGHIPPVQYPVAGQQQQQQQHQQQAGASEYGNAARRSSFNGGDDAAFFDHGGNAGRVAQQPVQLQQQQQYGAAGRGEEELFMSPTSAAAAAGLPSPSANAMSGYHHQFQAQTPPTPSHGTYNPQAFARSQSTSLPYHPHHQPAAAVQQQQVLPSRYGTVSGGSYTPAAATNYTPAPYNPALYSTTSTLPQRQATYHGYNTYAQHSYSAPAVPQVAQAANSTPSYVPQTPSYVQAAAAAAVDATTISAAPTTTASANDQSYGYPTSGVGAQQYASASSEQSYGSVYSGSYFANYSPSPYQSNGSSPAPGYAQTNTSQAPYPSQSAIPVGPGYASYADSNSSYANRTSRSNSGASPLPSPPVGSQQQAVQQQQQAGSTTGTGLGLQRHPTNAPLPSRPIESVPEEDDSSTWDGNSLRRTTTTTTITTTTTDDDEYARQANIIQDIEAELLSSTGSQHQQRVGANGDYSTSAADQDLLDGLRRYDSTSSTINTGHENVSRFPSTASTAYDRRRQPGNNTNAYYDDDDDSDPEGAAGLLAMQQAEADDRRLSGGASSSFTPFGGAGGGGGAGMSGGAAAHHPLPTQAEEASSSDSDYGATMDIGLFSGGYAGTLTYGNEVGSPPPTGSGSRADDAYSLRAPTLPVPSGGGAHHSYSYSSGGGQGSGYDGYDNLPALKEAVVDYSGTGGLQAPGGHRLSFEEGEERVSLHSGSDSPFKEDYPDMFYHPGLSNRPLPALPPGALAPHGGSDSSSMLSVQSPGNARGHAYSLSADSRPLAQGPFGSSGGQHHPPEGPASYYGAASGYLTHQQQVERSISLSGHTTTPQVLAPARSRTDADQERRRIARHMAVQQGGDGYDTGTPSSMAAAYDLPTIPVGRRRKFQAGKLTPQDLAMCDEPWALSGIADWVRLMAEGEQDLKRKTVEECLVRLFTEKVPTMNVADAESLGTSVVDSMFAAGMLLPEEEWVKLGPGDISGVLWQLTGSGCYAPRVHEPESGGRCYSYHCTRTLKKANLDELMPEESKKEDWVSYYKITKELIEGKDKKEIEKQNVLHEIVTSEEDYMNQLDVLRVLYKEQLLKWQPSIIGPNRLTNFVDQVFGKVETLQTTNRDNLLAQLKYRQKEQGPWITGFSDLFREWIRKARNIYVEYASSYPYSVYMMRRESDRNVLFRQFLDQVRNHKRSQRLDWNTFLKAPITRLQRYTLLLNTVFKNMKQNSEEKVNLAKAIEEIHGVTLECDAKVAEMQKKVEMTEIESMLVLREGMSSVLNFNHLGRDLILQGDLQRMGSKGVRWVDTHAMLFDHYFILAKLVVTKDGRADRKYDVSKEPIPMPLLFLESANDDPISKQKGITAPLTRAAATSASDTKLNKVASSNGGAERPGLEHAATSSSLGSIAVTKLTPSASNNDPEGKILYPFKVKHLGHDVYTLYATTPQSRSEWCTKITDAKARHAKALFEQNAEPFKLRVMADYSFAYDSTSGMGKLDGVGMKNTPLDRSIRDMEKIYGPAKVAQITMYRSQVNCATTFNAYGKSITAIGTDMGVFISEASNPRGWSKSVTATRVTQIAVLEDFSVCLVIADRSLVSYPLDAIAPVSSFPAPSHDNHRRAPQRLAKDVSFFATARMKDRMLIFYKRKEGMHNTFKVLEPVFQKSTEKKRGFFKGKGSAGTTESFRDFDEFYLPTECYSLNLFQTYIAVATAKGFELLTLDKKLTMSIPDLKQQSISSIAGRIRDQRPLGMFKLNDQEFLLTYEDCAVYVDKHGDVSRTLIMEYSGKQKKARGATMFGQYLLLFNEDYVEVRNAENGRLRQIIAGRDVRCLDYGVRGPTGSNSTGGSAMQPGNWPVAGGGADSKGTVKIAMSHPEIPGMQIVLEMLLNDGHTEAT